MRQTKHALTFLSSSYQAVFKHAYAAGLASSAVMLSLSSPYALAAVNADWDDSPTNTTLKQDLGATLAATTLSTEATDKGEWVVSGSESYNSNLTSTSVTINTGNSLTVSSNPAYDTSFYSEKGFYVNGGGFIIEGDAQDAQYHMVVQASADANGPVTGELQVINSYDASNHFKIYEAELNADKTTIDNSNVTLDGLTASAGSVNSDLFANYTRLNTGLNGGDTKVNRTNVTIGDHAAFNAVGKLSFTNRSSVTFQGASTSNGADLDIHKGQNAAKSQLRAESAEFYSDTGNTRITAQNGASAGVFVNDFSLQDNLINVNAGAQMQFAGLYNNTMAGSTAEIQAGTKLGADAVVDTNFHSSTMTITGDTSAINNSGKLTFGATSIVHDTSDSANPQAFTATAVKYTVDHNSGLFNNNAGAILNIGDDFDAASATHFKAAAGQGTTYNLNSGTLNNFGTINVQTGSALNVNEVAVFTADSGSELNIASGGSVSMHAAALSAQSGEQYSFGQKLYTAANLSNLGNVSNSGTLNLNQGLFVADGASDVDGSATPNSLGYRFLQALNNGSAADLGTGQVFVNDAILMLESGTQLNTSSAKLQGSQIAGSSSSTLYSAGQVNFTVDNITGEKLNGFSSLVAHDLTFQQDSSVSPENSPITLKPTADSSADQKLSFAATGSLNTANAQGNPAADLALSLENTQLRLSSSQLMLNVTELAADQEPTITAETNELNANLVLNSGSELLVEAGTWQGADRTITAQGDSQLKIDSQSSYVRPNTPESTAPTPFQTLAGLEVQKLELTNTASATVTNSGSLSVGDLLLQNSGTLIVNSGSSLSSTGTMLVSGTASATIQDAQAVALNALRINTGDAGAGTSGTAGGGMFVTNTDISAQNIDLSNGVLQVSGAAASDPTDLTNTNRFVTTGHMALGNSGSGSAQASFNRVDVELGSLTIHNSQTVAGEGDAGAGDAAGAVDAGGMELNAANLKVNGDVSVVNGALNFNQSFDTTASSSGTTSLASAANTTHSVQIAGDLAIGVNDTSTNSTGEGQVNLHQAQVNVDNVLISTADTTGGLRMTESNLEAQGEVSVNNGTLALGPAVTPLFNATAPEPYLELSVGQDLSITGTGQVHLNRVVAEADNVVIDADAALVGASGTPVLGSGGLYLTDSTLNTNSLKLSNGNFSMSNSSEQPSTIEQQLQIGSALLLSGLSKFELNAINGSAQGIGLSSSGSVVNLNNSNFRSEGTYALDSQGQFNLTDSTFYADGNVQNQATGQLNAQNSTVQVFGNLVNSGSLNFNNSKLQNVTDLTSQGTITATNGSQLDIAGTMALGNGAQLTTDNSKLFTEALTGSGTLSFNNGSEVTIHSDGNGSTVDFAGAEVNLNSSKLFLGDAFNSLALRYDAEQGLVFGNNQNFATIQTDGGAEIYLDLSKVAGIENLTAQQLEDFKNKLQSGNGLLYITGVNIPSDPEDPNNPEKPAIVGEWNEAKQRWEIDYSVIAQYYDKIDFATEETIKSVLTVTSGSVAGAWAGIETVAGTSSFDVYASGTLSINGHAVNVDETGTDHLAQDAAGNVVGVNLNAGSALNINTSGTGTIGNILEADAENLSAFLNIYNADQIKIQATGGAERSQILVGTLNSQATIHVQDLTTNQATFNGGGLDSEVVSVSGTLAAVGSTFKVLTSLNAGAINASNSVFNSSGSLTTQSFSGTGNTLSANELSTGTITGSGNKFIAKNTLTTADITGDGNALNATTMTIGNVSGSKNSFDATTLTMGNLTGSGNTVTADDFTAQDLTGSAHALLVTSLHAANADLTNSRIEAEDITLTGAGKFSGGSITAQSFTGNELSLNGTKVDLSGDVTAQGQVQVVGNASLLANNLSLGSGDLLIGEEATAGTAGGTASTGSSGKVVLNHLDLNGNNLFLDPEFGQQTATLFVKNIGDLETIQSGTTVVNGNLVLGRNTAMGLGGTEQAFNRELAKHQDATTHSLSSQGIGSYLYLDTHNIQLGEHKLIMGSEDLATLKDKLTNGEAKIYLGSNAGMQVTANALNAAKTSSSQIFSDLDNTDIIESTDGTLILPSGVTAADLASIFGEDVQLASGSTIKVQTANGLYSGVIDSVEDLQGTGDFEMSISKESRYILREVSDPTYNYYLSVMPSLDAAHEQQIAQAQAQASADATGSADTPAPAGAGAGYLFLSQAGSEKSGRIIEQSARLASFGMGVQIAHQTAQTTADAISQRLGMGLSSVHAGANSVDNQDNQLNVHANNGTAVWFSPSYQNYQSSSFKADNLHYGSDINFYGMVAGIDHTFVNGVQVGAVLNIGQGDASGEGIASGVNNNFNYYGAGLFASVQPMPNLTLSADAGYNFVSSDLESTAGITGYDKVTGDADSQALTAGVKAQYQFKALGMDFAPHAGVRYTRISLDSYDFKADGQTIGHTDTADADVLSIPLGVVLSTTLKANDWVIQPRADFTVTANIGADSIGSESTFDGAAGSVKYDTEFMDKFTYGVAAGVNVRKGHFQAGADVGYTGSSNTQEISAQGTVQYRF